MSQVRSSSPAVDPVRTVELFDLLRARLEPFAARPAFSSAEEFVTFERLFSSADRLAKRFAQVGVGPGVVIGLALPNCVELVTSLLAAFQCSATVALVSSKYRKRELEAIQDHLSPACYLTSATASKQLREELESISPMSIASTDHGDLQLLLPRGSGRHAMSTAEVAIIKLTSGSTGVPKGIALSPAHVVAEARNIADTLALSPADRILAPVPLAHSYGFDLGVLSMLWTGASLVARNTFVPRRLLADMEQREISVFLGVPSIYRTLVDIPVSRMPDLSHIRYLLSCTAPLHPQLIADFRSKFAVPICQHYGSSETGAATTHVPSLVEEHPESVGRAMSGVQVRIVDEGGNALPRGQEGEVVIAGAAVASGYVMGAPAGESPFRRAGYWSGDLGFLDDKGLLHLTGRKSQIINVGGLKVSPNEVAQVLEGFAPVAEAVVLGLKGSGDSDIVCAVVTLRTPTTPEAILEHCRQSLADYKVPRRIEIRLSLPKSDTGKVKLTAEDLGL